MDALRRKQAGYRSVWDRLGNDLFIIGEVAFDRCTPRKLYAHAPWWTLIVTTVRVSKLSVLSSSVAHACCLGKPLHMVSNNGNCSLFSKITT